ncbi:hypothetical protein J2T57_001995 [Natronocella acetinitrilica]|uniref:Uncharacterized protein n=1 Tax=Natronocella acetinitrilica TaxID=414046 RepID=A0AAE3KG58_9GAMM|nr:hypothetical protein [Natronocella acetinitrilica]MCP1674857.1 hypothetical protein [Natronocella acetinitrilica]
MLTVGVANILPHLERMADRPRWLTRAAFGEGFMELAELSDSRH